MYWIGIVPVSRYRAGMGVDLEAPNILFNKFLSTCFKIFIFYCSSFSENLKYSFLSLYRQTFILILS